LIVLFDIDVFREMVTVCV